MVVIIKISALIRISEFHFRFILGDSAPISKRIIPLAWPNEGWAYMGKQGSKGNYIASQPSDEVIGTLTTISHSRPPKLFPSFAWKSNRPLGNFRDCNDRGCVVKTYSRFTKAPSKLSKNGNIRRALWNQIRLNF